MRKLDSRTGRLGILYYWAFAENLPGNQVLVYLPYVACYLDYKNRLQQQVCKIDSRNGCVSKAIQVNYSLNEPARDIGTYWPFTVGDQYFKMDTCSGNYSLALEDKEAPDEDPARGPGGGGLFPQAYGISAENVLTFIPVPGSGVFKMDTRTGLYSRAFRDDGLRRNMNGDNPAQTFHPVVFGGTVYALHTGLGRYIPVGKLSGFVPDKKKD